ncbi:hypothetical protein [Aquibacillus saliphilus]|uniref:hypothetical protein n=1 Tax=Aquibacillus saliphilus TaxID=1909422 RepID=UPI001CF0B0EA|nr:hypothetical protein [Aquibacillus saliphilus]
MTDIKTLIMYLAGVILGWFILGIFTEVFTADFLFAFCTGATFYHVTITSSKKSQKN